MKLHIPPALHHRQFRLLWVAAIISITGSQLQTWSLLWHVRTLSDQPIALGMIGLARILPIIAFSLLGGAVADVVNRKLTLIITQCLLALIALALALLTFSGSIELWHIYALTGLQAAVFAFDLPARQAMIPNLVPARDLPNAFSLTSIANQTGSILGPAFSGLVIAYWSQPYTYLLNAISYLAIILSLLLMGRVTQLSDPSHRTRVSLSAIREGVGFILQQPMILSTMLLDFFATFFSSANTLMPIFTRDILKVGAVEYGWLSSAQSIGAVSAALVISQLEKIRHQGPIFLGSVVVFGLATIGFGLSRAVGISMMFLMVIGASDTVSMIIRNTIRQLQTPDYLRGRMTSVNQIFFMGGPQLGEIEAGVVAQFLGAPFAVITGGIGCIMAVAAIARRWPVLRSYNGEEPLPAQAATD